MLHTGQFGVPSISLLIFSVKNAKITLLGCEAKTTDLCVGKMTKLYNTKDRVKRIGETLFSLLCLSLFYFFRSSLITGCLFTVVCVESAGRTGGVCCCSAGVVVSC